MDAPATTTTTTTTPASSQMWCLRAPAWRPPQRAGSCSPAHHHHTAHHRLYHHHYHHQQPCFGYVPPHSTDTTEDGSGIGGDGAAFAWVCSGLHPARRLVTRTTNTTNLPTRQIGGTRPAWPIGAAPQPLLVHLHHRRRDCARHSAITPHASAASTSSGAAAPPVFPPTTTTTSAQQKPTRHNQQPNDNAFSKLIRYTLPVIRQEPFIAWRLALCVLSNLASKIIALAVPFAFKRAFDLLASAAPGGGTAATTPTHARLALLAFVLHGAAKLVADMARELRTGVFAIAGQRLGRRITTLSLAHLHALETEFHIGSRTGALTRVLDRGTRSIMTIVRSILFYVLPCTFELALVCGILMSRFSWSFGVVVLVAFFAFVAYSVIMNNKLTAVKAQMNVADNEASAKILDSLLNSEVVARFNASAHEVDRLDTSMVSYEQHAVQNDWLICWQNVGQALIYTLCLTALLTLCVGRVLRGAMTVGDVLMVTTLLQQLWFPLQFIGFQYRELRQAMVDLGNLFCVLDRPPKLKDTETAKPLVVTAGAVHFENVSFSYPEDEDILPFFQRSPSGKVPRNQVGEPAPNSSSDVLEPQKRKHSVRNLTFTVPAGKTVALVGRSGSGKSSVLRLLSRAYDVSEGRILIDGQDIAKVTLASLREAVCIVPQDAALFNDTLGYNIRYGKLSANHDEVVAAAEAAAIHDTIMRMPLNYNTIVGERGVRLSGGERQRISIARAFLRGSKILLQDEATSALDSRTEAEVTHSLNSLGADRTRVVVAHRLSTIFDADLILVMQRGMIVEQGTHSELLQMQEGVYADMWSRQSASELQDNGKVSEGISS